MPSEDGLTHDDCPELVKKLAGDETFYYCKLMECPCMQEYQGMCDEWDKIKEEWQNG